ncbi:MAG: LamG-like jellyroll fold domain-containing protein [Verrucomicrobiota bacterium]
MSDRQQDLVDGYCSGSLTGEEFAELERALRRDAELREQLLEYRMLDSDLRSFASTLYGPASAETTDLEPSGKIRRLRLERWAAAAVIILLLGIVGHLVFREATSTEPIVAETEDDGVALLVHAVEAKWKDASFLPYESISPGRWELLEGVIELEFYSGASVILEAPAVIEIQSEYGGTLHEGKLRAQVPVQAQGFTIRTRELKLVDLGTEFAVEVTQDNGTAVHVLDGKVELFTPQSATDNGQELTAGQGQLVEPNGRQSEIAVDADHFVGREELARRVREIRLLTYQRWQAASASLKADPRLLAYYDFQPVPEADRTLPNLSLNQYPEFDGAIVGAVWKWGRWRDLKRSLDFKNPADRVRIDVPGRTHSMTLAAWVRLDRFDGQQSVLLDSEEWERKGAVHWRILRRGALELVVNNGLSSKEKTSSVPCTLQTGDFHRWMCLVAVYDGEKGIVSQYRNGDLLGVTNLSEMVPVEVGLAEIANRTRTDSGSQKVRRFNGRFGELMIFKEALSASEISKLHENGNKYHW